MVHRRNELRNAASLILKLHIIYSRIRSEDQYLNAILVPLPIFRGGTGMHATTKRYSADMRSRHLATELIDDWINQLNWINRGETIGKNWILNAWLCNEYCFFYWIDWLSLLLFCFHQKMSVECSKLLTFFFSLQINRKMKWIFNKACWTP